ncbi:RNA polymerase sigma-70 factor [Flavivirga abyssicola]|uniref:RNA polymerase sigma factor n=1 Tax=Flavivirga abyssicola TaxID=3063533 RepID=UPI0026E06993|nr:RNA polymerase sigma-70 factor [Flavivirga sp. MEBiC07777]WVK12741.1 RNA polymerase sigma-70 factor [Flavivirga sp. MEBiC07777]
MTLKKLDPFWQLIKNRDRRVFGEFYELYYPLLLARSLKFVSDQETCKEIVQDTFTIFWKKAHTITPEKHFMEAYLWQILRSLISKFYRGKKEKKVYIEEFDRAHALITKQEELTLKGNELETKINSAIEALPEKTKQIFVMSRLSGMTYIEISKELDISVKTVEYHMSNALKILRENLKSYLYLFLAFFKRFWN